MAQGMWRVVRGRGMQYWHSELSDLFAMYGMRTRAAVCLCV